ncbi:phosphatidate phosphatase LPIN2-like [Limulus polyphemus]|uniref:phosphatidate phosphatase n=1 Tax=Limulus polyphemus TaxID=6850 RepID=A0ABM1BIV4_LIMPO|nr:phosphatidate phosphatase LPIN2-like [Limulus polyphemus]XP_013782869.1 phosphatidate phosphatase LPIN2-like [Limulus polyphemus]XP_013782870.1 phosphatidate phosphatase LPIN2-like [Limulus polyphemus]
MNYIGKFISNFQKFYSEINSATLTGAIDVVVVKQPDGSYISSPFHVRFGKIGVLRCREKVVDIEVNGEQIDIHMKLGESGEAFFVEAVEEETVPSELATSPIPSCPDIGQELRNLKEFSKSDHKEVALCLPGNDKPENDYFGEVETTFTVQDSDQFIHGMVTNEHYTTQFGSRDVEVERQEISAVGLLSQEGIQVETNFQTTVVNTIPSSQSGILTVPIISSCPTSPSNNFNLRVPNFVPIKKTFDELSVGVQTDISLGGHEDTHSNQFNRLLSGQLPMDVTFNIEEEVKTRKKRKRKIGNKRRPRSQEVISHLERRDSLEYKVGSSQEHCVPDDDVDDIFKMDDDYLDDSNNLSTLSRSVTLPLANNKLALPDVEWTTRRFSASYLGDFHPFSDGDITPIMSPTKPRPPSPKSDSEFEIQKYDAVSQTESDTVSWKWGEFPKVPQRNPEEKVRVLSSLDLKSEVLSSDEEELPKKSEGSDERKSLLGGVLNFMRTTKKMHHKPESEGIYLDDLNPDNLNPEVAALYLSKFRSPIRTIQPGKGTESKDEDAESGNGPSLPQSPLSVEGAISGSQSLDSDSDERHSVFDICCKYYTDLALSLCGGLQDYGEDISSERFQNFLVTYDEICENPILFQNSDLVVRMGGKYYNWQTAAPMIMSLATYRQPLPTKSVAQLVNSHMPKKKKQSSYSWWSWRRPVEQNQGLEIQTVRTDLESVGHKRTFQIEEGNAYLQIQGQDKKAEGLLLSENKPSSITVVTCESEEAVNIQRYERNKAKEEIYTSTSSETDTELGSSVLEKERIPYEKRIYFEEKYKKSLRLSSEKISSLKLKPGANEVVFSVTTAYQGTTRCKCHIYLWNYDDKIVVSDIDGTITKSDVLGHILPIIGKDWAQSGVATLFTKVKNNGYQFLYLSARAIGQARVTRDYLRSVKQGNVCLPDGPLLLSPTSLLNALHREVIEKKPEVFKISCLKDIQALFPTCVSNPLYAGFGNKINDTWAYKAVKVPVSRIFTINHRGELKLDLMQNFQSSYTSLSDVVDYMFPPLQSQHREDGRLDPCFTSAEEFSSFTYWRSPPPPLKDDDNFLQTLQGKV